MIIRLNPIQTLPRAPTCSPEPKTPPPISHPLKILTTYTDTVPVWQNQHENKQLQSPSFLRIHFLRLGQSQYPGMPTHRRAHWGSSGWWSTEGSEHVHEHSRPTRARTNRSTPATHTQALGGGAEASSGADTAPGTVSGLLRYLFRVRVRVRVLPSLLVNPNPCLRTNVMLCLQVFPMVPKDTVHVWTGPLYTIFTLFTFFVACYSDPGMSQTSPTEWEGGHRKHSLARATLGNA